MKQDAVDRLVAEVVRLDREITLTKPRWPMPSKGWHRARCVDVADLGIVQTTWGPKAQLEFAWNIEEVRADGRQHLVWRRFRPTLLEDSTLRRFLEVWQGYPFSEEELTSGVQLISRFLHRPCMVLIDRSHTARYYHSVVCATPMPASKEPLITDGFYVRRINRGLVHKGVPRGGPEAVVEEGPVPRESDDPLDPGKLDEL